MESIFSPKASNHYFNVRKESYKKAGLSCINNLYRTISQSQKNKLRGKLQIDSDTFREESFLQIACELSVSDSFLRRFPHGFEYERKLTGESDADLSFISEKIRFNVEVKCFLSKPNVGAGVELKVLGPHLGTSVYQELASAAPSLSLNRSRLLSIVDFMKDAKRKFSNKRSGEFDVLLICCFDLNDYIDTITCLAGDYGISYGKNNAFKNISEKNIDSCDFQEIDAVVVTNIGNLHLESENHPAINPWDYKNCFSLGFQLHIGHQLATNDELGLVFKKTFNLFNDHYAAFCQDSKMTPQNYIESFPKYISSLEDSGHVHFKPLEPK